MEERVFNKNTLFAFFLGILLIGCTHTPTNSKLADSTNQELSITDFSTQNPDFISPLLNDSNNLASVPATSNEGLIWKHIENRLALTELYNHPRIIQEKEKFINNSAYLAVVTKRSEPFIHFVLSEIENRNLPAELAVLPIVESGYYPRARSLAKAEGLWQIMPYTAKALGIKRTIGYDGRHDVYASTSAALEYLSQMYNMFDGDWLLALAAYNAGPQRIKRALKKSNVQNEKNFWNLHLPRETREYVPKILALCSIIKDQEFSNSLLYPIQDTPYLETIELSKRISPAKLIQAANTSEAEIKLLNPAIRNLSTPIQAGYHLMVPKQDAEYLALAIDNLPEAPKASWVKHKINRGESLGVIAWRYGTTINALREANNLLGTKIVAGRSLIIPLHATSYEKTTAQVTLKTKSAVVKTKASSRKSSGNIIDEPYVYVVALGDSFWKIANRNNTTVKRLFEINGRSADQPLLPGESILVD
jgi:membrane-bound lytic murein transglycosylase D